MSQYAQFQQQQQALFEQMQMEAAKNSTASRAQYGLSSGEMGGSTPNVNTSAMLQCLQASQNALVYGGSNIDHNALVYSSSPREHDANMYLSGDHNLHMYASSNNSRANSPSVIQQQHHLQQQQQQQQALHQHQQTLQQQRLQFHADQRQQLMHNARLQNNISPSQHLLMPCSNAASYPCSLHQYVVYQQATSSNYNQSGHLDGPHHGSSTHIYPNIANQLAGDSSNPSHLSRSMIDLRQPFHSSSGSVGSRQSSSLLDLSQSFHGNCSVASHSSLGSMTDSALGRSSSNCNSAAPNSNPLSPNCNSITRTVIFTSLREDSDIEGLGEENDGEFSTDEDYSEANSERLSVDDLDDSLFYSGNEDKEDTEEARDSFAIAGSSTVSMRTAGRYYGSRSAWQQSPQASPLLLRGTSYVDSYKRLRRESISLIIGASTVAIDNKIEQAMDLVKSHLMYAVREEDLVKSHLMYAVREEVEVLREQIKDLMEKNAQLENENSVLRKAASPETLNHLQKNPRTTPGPQQITAGPDQGLGGATQQQQQAAQQQAANVQQQQQQQQQQTQQAPQQVQNAPKAIQPASNQQQQTQQAVPQTQGHPGVTQGHPGVSQGHPGVCQGHPGVSQGHPGGHAGVATQGHTGVNQDHHGVNQGHPGVTQGHGVTAQGHAGIPQAHAVNANQTPM